MSTKVGALVATSAVEMALAGEPLTWVLRCHGQQVRARRGPRRARWICYDDSETAARHGIHSERAMLLVGSLVAC